MPFLIIFIPTIDLGPDGNFGGLILLLIVANILLNLPIDVFSSWGMYRIAKRRGLRCPWLAWFPMVNLWMLGYIADHYQRKILGKKSGLRWLLSLWSVTSLVFIWSSSGSGTAAETMQYWLSQLYPLSFFIAVVGISCVYLALNRLYRSCRPVDCMEYTVLSVLLSFPTPYLILRCCKEILA